MIEFFNIFLFLCFCELEITSEIEFMFSYVLVKIFYVG